MKQFCPLTLMYITNRLDVAIIAQHYGVERIWIDLETLGKEERQANMNTVKSHHQISDIARLAPCLDTAQLMVRINPWHKGSKKEIEAVIQAGAKIIMLPYWKTVKEVSSFLRAVNGRCKTSLLLETKEAEACLDEVLKQGGMDEIHIGLNDLHLSYGLDFMFELLTNGTVERICKKIAAYHIPYGFGGIAKLGAGDVPAEEIILEHYRLGSTRVILSRSFCNTEKMTRFREIDRIFAQEMAALRLFEIKAVQADEKTHTRNRKLLAKHVAAVVDKRRAQKQGKKKC